MTTRNTKKQNETAPTGPSRPPIQWTRVLVGFALNIMVVTLAVEGLSAIVYGMVISLIGPALVGALMGFTIRDRPGIHTFLGGMASIPFLAIFIVPTQVGWPYAVLCGGVFALAGLLTDLFRRFSRRMDPT